MVAGHQHQVQTPFVPSTSWISCVPMCWNEGFPTPLGGRTVYTNPVKAPDIRFLSSQFHERQ